MLVLFEDNARTPSSCLIRSSSPFGCATLFADGASRVLSHLEEIASQSNLVLVYMDLVPNNISSIQAVSDVLNWVVMTEASVLLVPLICTEFHILQAISRNYAIPDEVEHLLDLQFSNLARSAEKQYKDCLNKLIGNSLSHCFNNENKRSNSRYGLWYKQDCTGVCDICRAGGLELSLMSKAYDFCLSLPVFAGSQQFYGAHKVDVSSIRLCALYQNRFLFYNQLCNSLSLSFNTILGNVFCLLDATYDYLVRSGVCK